uniref:Ssu-2 homolog, related sequence 1 n=1 Tax=Eptatretus burgeri TaxID=7764 RepID=A0A8C4Q6L0_EPTBU
MAFQPLYGSNGAVGYGATVCNASPAGPPGMDPGMHTLPTAPPNFPGNVVGYEGTVIDSGHNIPPPPVAPQPFEPSPQTQEWRIPALSEEEGKEALLEYVSGKCCYSQKPVTELEFSDIKQLNTYRYHLETFTEQRSTAWESEPFDGMPENIIGPAPLPWSIAVDIPVMFAENEKKIPVPNTSSVKPCHNCLGMCRRPCSKCNAMGRVECSWCHGNGQQFDEACSHCSGQGQKRCETCNGNGQCPCKECKAKGQLKYFIMLTVTWKNITLDFVEETRSGFSTELLKHADGQEIFHDEQPMCCNLHPDEAALIWKEETQTQEEATRPINSVSSPHSRLPEGTTPVLDNPVTERSKVQPLDRFPNESIRNQSQAALSDHLTRIQTSRIVRQKHIVDLIPLTKFIYELKGKTHEFYVYGTERKVYAPDYPGNCKCCVIL